MSEEPYVSHGRYEDALERPAPEDCLPESAPVAAALPRPAARRHRDRCRIHEAGTVSTRSHLFLLALALLSWAAGPAFAREPAILVTRTGPEAVSVNAPRVVTVVFRVTNPADRPARFQERLVLPPFWRPIAAESPFTLDPAHVEVRLVSFYVPATTPAGDYQVTYLLADPQSPDQIVSSPVFTVVVLPAPSLRLTVLSAPELVVAGGAYTATFQLANPGNVDATVALSARSQDNFPASVNPQSIHLAAGGLAEVAVTVRTDSDFPRPTQHRVTLQASSTGAFDDVTQAHASSAVNIMPRPAPAGDAFHTLPMRLTLRGLLDDRAGRGAGLQTEISGSGPLDEEGRQHIDFLLIAPDLDGGSLYGERDEAHVSLWTETWRLDLGDQVFSLTPLTERFLYGRGVRGRLALDDFAAGVYYAESRWLEPSQDQSAAYVSFPFAKRATLDLSFLHKRIHQDAPAFPRLPDATDILSARARFVPADNLNMDLEFAWGANRGGTLPDSGAAGRLALSGNIDRLAYQMTYFRAAPGFFGYHNDMDFLSAGVTLPLFPRLRLQLDHRREKRNLDLNPVIPTAPRDLFSRAGLRYRISPDATLTLDVRTRSRRDLLPSPSFDFTENTFRLGAVRRFDKTTFDVFGEWGESHDDLTSRSSSIQRYRFSAYVTPSRKNSYAAYVEFSDSTTFTARRRPSLSGGLRADLQLNPSTSLGVRASAANHHAVGKRYTAETRLNHRLRNGADLSATAGYTAWHNGSQQDHAALMVSYSVPFQTRLHRKRTTGSIRGTVRREEDLAGIPNVIVTVNGQSALTGPDGEFLFPSLVPGVHQLRLDAPRIALDRITSRPLPLAVVVRPGETTEINLDVTRAACLRGQIVLVPARERIAAGDNGEPFLVGSARSRPDSGSSPDTPDTDSHHGVPGVLVQLTSGSETHHRLSGLGGEFNFERLRPGSWSLTIMGDNLSDEYDQPPPQTIELLPAQERTVLLRMTPRRRPIRIIDQGELRLEGTSP